jgi:PAS domain S-box-containing protein
MRLTGWLQWHSLKTRVPLLTLGVFLVGIWSMWLYTSHLLREDLQRLLGNQQFTMASALAAEINQALDERLKSLQAVAATIDPAAMESPQRLQAQLEQLPVLRNQFNGGVITHRIDGAAIADVPREAGRIGVNYMDIDSVAAALTQGRSTVGQPVMGKKLSAPVFGMTVPIRDAQGQVIGALSGVTDLSKPGFLDNVTHGRYGESGGYTVLVAKRQRLVITATDKRRIMTTLPAPGLTPLLDRFIEGHEGSGVAVNPMGVEVLASVKGVPAADWYVSLARPTSDVYAPIDAMQQRMLLAALLLSLLVGGLTWWMLKRQLSPLLDTVTTLSAFKAANQPPQLLPIARQDEIGELIGGFNHLLATLGQREATLRESEERYRSFFQASPDAIFVHRDNTIVFANDATARLFHADSVTQLIGQDWHDLVASKDWPITESRIASLMSGETSHMPPLERSHLALDGQVIAAESTGARIIFDGKPAVLTVIRDITLRKQTETQRLADARQQRDTLVREVHHRIKNNLQSVAGLLQRELGKFPELNPNLQSAISQVHAIALVHGLQSAGPDESIRLCDSVRNICQTVAELSLRPVSFHIEDEQTTCLAVQIASDEAVAVALVLNELILNAVKHSPPDSMPPTVSLRADESSAVIAIRNAVKGQPAFNIATGQGLGTGLRLVSSLLPDQGAQLRHELDTTGGMLTSLTLTLPVVIQNIRGNRPGGSS